MISREFKLYLNAGVGVAPVINVNQFDQDEEWIFTLLQSDGTVYTPSTGAIIGLKQDGTTILNAGTVNSSGQVVITETEQMTAVPGSNLFEILIDGNTHGTANFVVFVERRPGDIDNPSESDISLFQEAIEAAGNVTQFQADISALQSGLSQETQTRQSQDTSLASQIAQEASTRSQQDAVLQAEIDQIIAPSGEAPSAAEVQNARIGVDGTTYDTLGNAIRTQVSDLKNAINDADDVILGNSTDLNLYIKGTNVYGKYWTYTGGEATGQNVCVTDYIPVNEGVTYTYSGLTNVGSAPHSLFFDSSKTYLSGFKQKVGSNNTITAPTGAKYVSFSILGSDDATFEFMSPIALATKTEVEAVDDAWRDAFQTGVIYKNIPFEQGGFSNTNENTTSNIRIRSVNLIDFSGYEKVTIELDEGYKIIRLDYDGTPPYDMTQWISQSYTFGVAENMLYRFGFAKSDDSAITPSDASHVRFKVAEFDSPSLEELKTTAYQVRDPRPTYVILDFDGDIESMTDNRVTLVNEQYGYPFTFVGISQPSVTREMLKRGCDLSIYSNASGYLPDVSTINSTSETDIQAWDRYVKEVLDRYNNAGFYNQVCWSCQGMNYGSALETALKKYGFKMARGNQVGATNSIYIDEFDDTSYRVGCYQIYTDRSALALQQVTNAVTNGKDICIFTHKIVDTAEEDRGYDCTKATYTAFLEGLKAKEEAGQVKVVSFREYYKMHCPKSNNEYDYNRIFKTIWHDNQ